MYDQSYDQRPPRTFRRSLRTFRARTAPDRRHAARQKRRRFIHDLRRSL